MQILVLSNVPPSTVGGAEIQALHLARQWSAAGHTVSVAGPANLPHSEGNLSIFRIPVLQRTRALRAITYLAGAIWLMWRRREYYDVVYCRFLGEQAFAASLAKIILRIRKPIVACPACASSGGEAARISRSRLRRIWLAVFRRGLSYINAMSRQIEKEIYELGLGSIPISRIPNGVPLPANTATASTRGSPARAIFVGRLVAQKGVDILIEAARKANERGVFFNLYIIGDGPLRPFIEHSLRAGGLDKRVFLLGSLSPEKVAQEMSISDIFILPSRYEGMPGALIEAAAHGLPAIATRVSGSEEIVDEKTGWLVSASDASALAGAIECAFNLSRNELKKMGQRARIKAAVEYDIKQVASRYLELFRELVESTKDSSASDLPK